MTIHGAQALHEIQTGEELGIIHGAGGNPSVRFIHQGVVPMESELAGVDTFTLEDPESGVTLMTAAVDTRGRVATLAVGVTAEVVPDRPTIMRFLGSLIGLKGADAGYLSPDRTNIDPSVLDGTAGVTSDGDYLFVAAGPARFQPTAPRLAS